MNLNIREKKEEPLLSRTKIIAEIIFDKETPSKKDIKSTIVSSLKSSENLVVVRRDHVLYVEFLVDR